jgi:hypothetical protein
MQDVKAAADIIAELVDQTNAERKRINELF